MEEATYYLIEDYLAGKLSPKELAAFELRLQTDTKFAQKVQLMKTVETTLADTVRQDIHAQLNDLGTTYFTQPVVDKKKIKPLPLYRKPWVMAASFLLLATLSFLWWQNQPTATLSNEQLFAQHYQSPDLSTISRGDDSQDALRTAITLYSNQDYATALVQLQALKKADPTNQKLTYLLAHTYLNLMPPQLEEARAAFAVLIQHGQNVYVLKAKWYLGLLYVRQNSISAAQPLLEAVAASTDSNSKKAGELLELLERK